MTVYQKDLLRNTTSLKYLLLSREIGDAHLLTANWCPERQDLCPAKWEQSVCMLGEIRAHGLGRQAGIQQILISVLLYATYYASPLTP